MIGYYPYVVATLFLIYPQWTDQISTCKNVREIQQILLDEKAQVESNVQGQGYLDIACDQLLTKERDKLCEDLMDHLINDEPDNGTLLGRSELLKTGDPHVESPLAPLGEPNFCKSLSIEGLNMGKFMYWCPHTAYVQTSRNTVYVEGFFIASSLKESDTAILFRPSPTNAALVTPFFAMHNAGVLSKKLKELGF